MTDADRQVYEEVFTEEHAALLKLAGGHEIIAFRLYSLQTVRDAAAEVGMDEEEVMALLIANTKDPIRTRAAVSFARAWEKTHPVPK